MAALDIPDGPVNLDKDVFLRRTLGELTGLLQDAVGPEDAANYISSVGAAMGRWMNGSYQDAWAVDRLTPRMVASAFVDLKDRLGGSFEVVEFSSERIVLENSCCPFGEVVLGKTALCMMTSSVFGRIAADNLGYANVVLEKTLARGDRGCRVSVFLRPMSGTERILGQEYYSALSGSNAAF